MSGQASPEPWADGKALQVNNFSCRLDEGPLKGADLSGHQVYEYQGGEGRMLAGFGVMRAPGASSVYQHTDGRNTLAMSNGNVVGASGSGRSVIQAATGASLNGMAGKTYRYATKATGPRSFILDVTDD